MNPPSATIRVVPWFILGFLLLAFASLAGLLLDLVIASSPASMDPWKYRLLLAGWGASVVFAAAYHFAPLMAGAPLWSPTSGWIHLVLHTVGLGLLAHGQFAGEGAAAGSMLVACGAGLFALNFMITAGIKDRWTPSNLLFVTSLLWLAVDLVVTTQLAIQAKPRGLVRSPEWTTRLAENAMVIGFLWQATLAIALEATKRHLSPSRPPDVVAWFGFASLNLGLASVLWLPDAPWASSVQSALLATGLFTLVIALAGAIRAARVSAAPVAGFSIGIAASAVMLAGCWPFPTAMGNALAAVIHLLGISWICLAARLVPFAFAEGRTSGFIAEHRMPSLVFGAGFSCLLLGIATLADSGPGARVGATLLLATLVWWLFTLSPAWSRLWGSPIPASARKAEV